MDCCCRVIYSLVQHFDGTIRLCKQNQKHCVKILCMYTYVYVHISQTIGIVWCYTIASIVY